MQTGRLSLSQAEALGHSFHQLHGLDDSLMNEWLESIENRTARGFYSKGLVSNYPAIAFQFYKTFYPPEPVSVQLYFEWDAKLSKRRGVSLSGNENLGIDYSVPEILADLARNQAEGEKGVALLGGNDPVEAEGGGAMAVKAPADVISTSEEQSFYWWWFAGAVILFGGICFAFIRRG